MPCWTSMKMDTSQQRSNICKKAGELSPAFRLRATGLEPARRRHQNLNLARLPIPPCPHKHMKFSVSSAIADVYIKKKSICISTDAMRHRGFEPRTT